jgi:pimeloyl-ACP methyl ester carboxylesterase
VVLAGRRGGRMGFALGLEVEDEPGGRKGYRPSHERAFAAGTARVESSRAAEAAAAPEAEEMDSGIPTWIAGPAGNLYVRDTWGDRDGAEGSRRAGAGGRGPRLPVLFVHSLAGNGGQWALQLDHLRRSRRAVAIDLRGHGDSDPADDGVYDLQALAADVGAVADQLSLRRFVLVGHSLGASVAIAYAGLHGERVAGLLLVDPNGDQTLIPRAEVEPFLAALRGDPLRELESYFRQLLVGGDRDAAHWVIQDLRLTHEDAIVRAVEASILSSPLPALARYHGPKLSVISDMNRLPFSLHNLVSDLPVHLMRGTGHWLMLDRPEAFNQVLDGFLHRVEG